MNPIDLDEQLYHALCDPEPSTIDFEEVSRLLAKAAGEDKESHFYDDEFDV